MSNRVYKNPVWTRTKQANDKRRATILKRVNNGQWIRTGPRKRIKWNCEYCGFEKQTTPSDKLRYCTPECSQKASIGRRFISIKHKAIRDRYRQKSLDLYQEGHGCKSIAKLLGTRPKIIRAILIEEGVYQPGKLRHLAGASIINGKRVWVAAEIKKSHRKYPTNRIRNVAALQRTRAHLCVASRILQKRKNPTRTREERKQRYAAYCKERYHNDPEYRIYQLCRRRMKKVLHGVEAHGRCMELVGCTTAHLRAHIESQFKPWMNWNNSGTVKGKWHIDHIIPCAVFDLTREDQQRICFHWTNLRPLGSRANMRKGGRLERDCTPCLL